MKRSGEPNLTELTEKAVQAESVPRKPRLALRYYVWLYFIIFTVVILALIWVFQYFFLGRYYKAAKTRDMAKAANKIIKVYGTDEDALKNTCMRLAFENNMCVVVTDSSGNRLILADSPGSGSKLSSDVHNNFSRYILELKARLNKSSSDHYSEEVSYTDLNAQGLIYCAKVYDSSSQSQAYVFLESLVEPIDSTASIIREQLIYITVIIFELSFVVTMFISKRLSKPITSVTNTAKQFAAGDYNVDFRGSGYREVEELSDVLNNARSEIKKVSDLRRDLIANISHDLRTPLTMVKAYAEMIRDLSGDDPRKRAEHVQIIIDEADRLSALVNNLLELSKLESGNMELEITDFSIVDKINDCMTRYTLLIEQNGYDIKYEPDEDRIISADINKLDQVIYNFINNAINYTGDNKVIRIKQINLENCVRIEVTDNGSGISKEMLPLIFDRYYRDAKVKRAVVGTGLGLSICKEILKKHGFAFGVSSVEGKGSTFWFEAPYARTRTDSKAAGRLESRLTYGGNNEKQGGE